MARYGKKYDTPMQEAYLNGFWDELDGFTKELFKDTFKENEYMERAILTGITRVSKESFFSGLNHLDVVATTTKKYETTFGFTEKEVFDALEEFGLSEKGDEVKAWYDSFTFGSISDIYNPWSIICFLDAGECASYWANTSSNQMISKLIRESKSSLDEMNLYMNNVALSMTSYFDSGNTPSKEQPERFYHGLVLGLIVDLNERYTRLASFFFVY